MSTRSETLERTPLYETTDKSELRVACSLQITSLNDDCLQHILSFLNSSDVLNVELVCRRFNLMSQEFWRTFRTFDVTREQLDFVSVDRPKGRNINVPLCQAIFAKCWNNLTKINLSRVERFESRTVMDYLDNCHSVTDFFTNERAPNESFICLEKLADCENIEELWLCRCMIVVSDENLKELFQRNKKLRFLFLNNYRLIGECLSHLPLNKLESLFLIRCSWKEPEYLNSVIRRAPYLDTLNFHNLDYFCLNNLKISSRCLKQLNVVHVWRGAFIPFIDNLDNLTALNCSFNSLDDLNLRKIIQKCTKLTALDISLNVDLTNVSLGNLNSLKHLKYLGIACIESFTDAGLLLLNHNLQSLNVAKTAFSKGAILTVVKRMQSLERLDIAYCKQLKNDFVEPVMDLVELRRNPIPLNIGIRGTSISEMKIKVKSPLVRLTPELNTNLKKYC
ncbi:hypothetical protein QAD02_004519 [Eretmocerus hayati]|uniref:Uncharacterized protein n=1 Tax=Eretmocerus hayati TaxID=131215 RepID=A0ACC2NSP1_9HYME|nr:hypothetical protein QAD02_004519 [Eretmocerus hayati]